MSGLSTAEVSVIQNCSTFFYRYKIIRFYSVRHFLRWNTQIVNCLEKVSPSFTFFTKVSYVVCVVVNTNAVDESDTIGSSLFDHRISHSLKRSSQVICSPTFICYFYLQPKFYIAFTRVNFTSFMCVIPHESLYIKQII